MNPSSRNTTNAELKQLRRLELRRLRKELEPEKRRAIDDAITLHCLELPEWERARLVFSYLSFGPEVDTRQLITAAWAQSKLVALPRCVPGSRRLRWHRVDELEHLSLSPLGMEEPEPFAEEVDPTTIDPHRVPAVALVPGLGFDFLGYRLGYGGGYYDGFLTEFAGPSVGLCRELALSELLEGVEPHDRRVSIVVTERRILRIT